MSKIVTFYESTELTNFENKPAFNKYEKQIIYSLLTNNFTF